MTKSKLSNPKRRERKWHLFDAQGMVLGRLASRIAILLQGKENVDYLPFQDNGDWVVVINAQGLRVTGKKRKDKIYYRYSGYPGGIKKESFADLLAKDPDKILRHAVKGMLPKNKLAAVMLKRLKVFTDAKHPFKAHFKD